MTGAARLASTPAPLPACGTCSGRMPIPTNRAGMRRRIGKTPNSFKNERRLRPLMGLQNGADDSPLDGELQPLREPHGQSAALLDGLKILVRHLARAERFGEPVGRGDCVLHRHVDAHAADRRHRMRRIADAEEPRPPPFLQPIDRDAEQFDVVPGFQFADAVGQDTATSPRPVRGRLRGPPTSCARSRLSE